VRDLGRLRDALHDALGAPVLKPSMLSPIEMAFESLEEEWFDRGVAWQKKQTPPPLPNACAMTRAEATNFIDHVLAARTGQQARPITDEILAGIYGGERAADMGNTDFGPDWGHAIPPTPQERDTMDPNAA